jgi:valyl-tRNA synthetase
MPDGSQRSLAESVPFRNVYIHALVRDANREKMSKTKGNVIDPIEIVKQYGTDAVRFTLASMASPGTDIAFNVARTEGYRAFANKIWNAARFLFMNVDRAAEIGITVDPRGFGIVPIIGEDAPLEARWIVTEFHKTAWEVNGSLDNYRYDDAANAIYQFFWGSFCDWYLEIVKIRLDFSETANKAATKSALTTLLQVFEASLRLLSPFMPFITEDIWHVIYENDTPAKSIALARYPSPAPVSIDNDEDDPSEGYATYAMAEMQKIITSLRALRKDVGVGEKEIVSAHIYVHRQEEMRSFRVFWVVGRNQEVIMSLARVSLLAVESAPLEEMHIRSEVGFDVGIKYEKSIDVAAERERLTKEIAKLEKNITGAEKQLGNDAFLAKAPPAIVEGLKKQEAENRLLLEKAKAALAALPPE